MKFPLAIAAGAHHSLALKSDGTVVSWGDNTYGQTNVPSTLTNPATANVIGIAAGAAHSMALKNDGTVIAWGDNTYGQTNTITNLTGVKAIAAGSYHSIALEFSPRVQYYPLTAAQDLLLIYNTNSPDSITVLNYYLAHRPMVGSVNVLAINYTHSANYENITPSDFTNIILVPVTNWLAANPTKRPQYVILFLDIPSRVDTNTTFETYGSYVPSLSYQLATTVVGWKPFVTHINMGATNTVNHTNDCIHYINKLATFGSNYSSGKLIISASAGGYGNTNYCFDDGRTNTYASTDYNVGLDASNGVTQNGAPANSIIYSNYNTNSLLGHITNGSNVAGYLCWGAHSALNGTYATNNSVSWSGNSSWYLIRTVESFNGRWYDMYDANFMEWYSANAFGGTNYLNTPVGAVSYTDEPSVFATSDSIYFGLWEAGRNFAICSWASKPTPYLQAVGDPFICR